MASPLLIAALGLLAVPNALAQDEAPSRRLLREFTSQPRLAGTTGSRWGAIFVERELRKAGWEVEVEELEVLLSLPRRIVIQGYDIGEEEELLFARTESFDPDAHPAGDVPPFNAWSASGLEFAPVIDAGYGLRADFEALIAAGVDPRGKIALARYGRSYRGVKAQLAEEYGCVAALLFSDPDDDGAGRGEVWPTGPWKPDWAAQRGSIAPMAKAPGDPSTPGWPSRPAGDPGRRLSLAECDGALPKILCTPIPAKEALALLAKLEEREIAQPDGSSVKRPVGPGPAHVQLGIDQPREFRTIHNVVGYLRGVSEDLVIAGNHRDAWVRGAHDAGGGSVALLRCAQRLGRRKQLGWQPESTIALAFWDAEETGLVGSTEWAEGRAEYLQRHCLAYINADAAVGGTEFRGASGTPGLLGSLRRALERVEQVDGTGSLWDSWVESASGQAPRFGLPGSGSDYTVFLHHLSLPVIDFSLRGTGGGQYHTAFDNFTQVDRHLDPTWEGHELAGALVESLLMEIAARGRESFDEAEAARDLVEVIERNRGWLGDTHATTLIDALQETSRTASLIEREAFYRRVESKGGLQGRSWYRNRLWAPGLETGYASETLPSLRFAKLIGPEALDFEVNSLSEAIKRAAVRR